VDQNRESQAVLTRRPRDHGRRGRAHCRRGSSDLSGPAGPASTPASSKSWASRSKTPSWLQPHRPRRPTAGPLPIAGTTPASTTRPKTPYLRPRRGRSAPNDAARGSRPEASGRPGPPPLRGQLLLPGGREPFDLPGPRSSPVITSLSRWSCSGGLSLVCLLAAGLSNLGSPLPPVWSSASDIVLLFGHG
jgi:hypothetical protein